jgi:2-C-methyl-D-erythritol 4-phosphate cytidylyltransferase/2-C-methyl-D-erythritol 2,4-cyclodiphosphate synthase
MSVYRTGLGFDVHRIQNGGRLRLCGVDIDCGFGLEGHSDADAALHALTDALLGAVAAGDIGEHFPPADERWLNADSRIFLAEALAIVRRQGFEIVNCDLTLVGERPRVSAHRELMRQSLAELLELPLSAVSVKGTTTEGLGFAGRGEGLAVMAAVLVADSDE